MKKRIIIAIVIAILMGSFSLVNYLSKDKDSSKESEVVKNIRNENYDTTETTTTTTTTTKQTTKKTTKKTTQKTKFNVIATQKEMLDYTFHEVLNMGWNSSEYEIVVKLVSHESGWDPNDVNKSSGACGLFQAHPCSKVFKQYPDYATNYKSQIKWGLNYIKDKYKTPTEAWNFWLKQKPYHWY